MRILHCIWSLTGGGAERQLRYLAPALAQRGHDVHVAFAMSGVHEEGLKPHCSVHSLGVSRSRDPRVALRVWECVERIRPDFIQTWLTHMDIFAGSIARLRRIPWILSERSAALSYPPGVLHWTRTSLGKRASLIIANSPGGADYWRANGALRVEVIPNFVRIEELDDASPVEDDRLNIGDAVIIAIGRLSADKNLFALVDAFRTLQKVRPNTLLVLCGEGPLRDAIEAHAGEVAEKIVFTGFVDVAPWLKRADVFASVSGCEGHPNAVLEALAARVPAVLSDIPAHRNVADDENAWFVPVDEPTVIATRIQTVLDNPNLASQKAARGRRSVEALSLDTVTSRYEELYRDLFARVRKARQIQIPGAAETK